MRLPARMNRASARGRTSRRGFTLVETVVSLAIISILVVSIGSAILIASRALPQNHDGSAAIVKAGIALEQIASELQYVVSVTERSAGVITFAVPDRSGDASPEKIRYAWSGVPGDPLTRQYNDGTVVTFAENVHEFEIACDLRAITETASSEQESAEILLIGHDDTGGTAVSERTVVGQFFRPALPPEAVGWRITRVKFQAKYKPPPTGTALVQIRTADANSKPTATVLGHQLMLEANLTKAYAWQEFAFPGLPVLQPTDGACLVIMDAGGGDDAYSVWSENGGVDTPDAHYVGWTSSSGWTIDAQMDMLFQVYGTVITTEAAAESTRYYVTGASLTLQMTESSTTRVKTGVQVVNEPEVTVP